MLTMWPRKETESAPKVQKRMYQKWRQEIDQG